MERKIRKIIVILMLLSITTNVQAITSNDVTYDNNGTTENLTESLDTLYNELKKYKTGGSVEANQMLAGVSGYSKGVLVTGTIPSKGATTYTPGTTNQTITSGQYLSGTQTIVGDADLKAENIKSGVNLFGVWGSHTAQNHNVVVVKSDRVEKNGGDVGSCSITTQYTTPAKGRLLLWMEISSPMGAMQTYGKMDVTACMASNGGSCVSGIKATGWTTGGGVYGKYGYWDLELDAGDSVYPSVTYNHPSNDQFRSCSMFAIYIY